MSEPLTREEIESIRHKVNSSMTWISQDNYLGSKELDALCTTALALMAKVERLRSEVDRVHNTWSDEYAAETAKLNGWLSDCIDKRNELQTEVERLRPVVEAAQISVREGHATPGLRGAVKTLKALEEAEGKTE